MRTYCSLIVSSDFDADLETTVLRTLGLSGGEAVDTQTPDMVSRRERFTKLVGVSVPITTPRYFWRLTSKDEIDSEDLGPHINWLLQQLAPGRYLRDLGGCSVRLACFWAGSGRGSGPLLPAGMLELLAKHGVEMQFEFYAEQDERETLQ